MPWPTIPADDHGEPEHQAEDLQEFAGRPRSRRAHCRPSARERYANSEFLSCREAYHRRRSGNSELTGAADALCPNRNGGRHCCQPPLRRAKDLPVFVAWSRSRKSLNPTSRSWLTSSGVASHRIFPPKRSPTDLLISATRRIARLSTRLAWRLGLGLLRIPLPGQNRSVFHGPSWTNLSCVPLCSIRVRRPSGAASRLRKISSSGASYRLAPRRLRRAFASPVGGDRTFGHLPLRSTLAGFPRRPGPPSRSPDDNALAPSRGSEIFRAKPVDNGDFGNKAECPWRGHAAGFGIPWQR